MKTGKPKRARSSIAGPNRPQAAQKQDGPERTGRQWATFVLLPLLIVAALAAYHPAWHGGLLWDDASHITAEDLRPLEGLQRIWFDPGATQQYYPVLHSAFWLQYRLWGDSTLGYHLVGIVLHALSALLMAVILRRLGVPGAWLAAVVFALHPVHVESVAWITELKNTLSGALYLAAAFAYIRFDRNRGKRLYALAFSLFALALLAKTVTATLPAALLVVFWWQRGALNLRRDAWPLMPFFALGASAGLFTAWLERTWIGAQGADFHFTLLERCLIAGRVIWFYLGKLFWPADLIFIYPRWEVSESAWWQYLYPLGIAALLTGLWLLRKRSRAPLAAMLLFCGTLFPVLGFFNVFPFRYSFVADHFQYLASMAIIALFSAGLTTLVQRWVPRSIPAAVVMIFALGGPLSFLTWSQSRQYVDAQTLYETTILRNPLCWMAHNNLGALKLARGDVDAAQNIEEAVRLKPDFAEARYNLGRVRQRNGQLEEAVTQYRQALRIIPNYPEAHSRLGSALHALGRLQEAEAHLGEALRLKPEHYEARQTLGHTLRAMGRLEDAAEQYNQALKLGPDDAQARVNVADVLLGMGRLQEAVAHYHEALRLGPGLAEAHNGLGCALQRMGRLQEAAARLEEALRLKPDYADAYFNLGNTLQGLGRLQEAVTQYKEALRRRPDDAPAHNNLGVALEGLGRLAEAVAQYREALRIDPDSADARANLARFRY